MRVAVCCKGVPINTQLESVQVVDRDLHFRDTEYDINEVDAYALEAAAALKKSHGAETVALTLGPLRAQEALYIAIAKGIDRVLRIDGETSLPELIAAGLVPPLKEIHPELILVGVQSEDWMGGEVGIYLSQALNIGLAYAVVEICELTGTHVRVRKEVGGGKKAEVLLKIPAVLCVQSGIQPLRYVSMMKRQKARNNPIQSGGKLNVEDAKQMISGMMAYETREVFYPSKGRAEMIVGDRPERVSRILEIIAKAV
jgi:electron transfer flavoprotein beta subunit